MTPSPFASTSWRTTRGRVSGIRYQCSPLTLGAAPDTPLVNVPPVIPAKAGIHSAWTELGCRCSGDGRVAASVYRDRGSSACVRFLNSFVDNEFVPVTPVQVTPLVPVGPQVPPTRGSSPAARRARCPARGPPADYRDKLPPKLLVQFHSTALAHNPAAVNGHRLRSTRILPSCDPQTPPRKTRPGFSSVRTPALITGFPLTSTCAIPVA